MTTQSAGPKVIALSLAAIASLAELGPISALLWSDFGIIAILVAGAAYQAGNSLPQMTTMYGMTLPAVVLTVAASTMLLISVGEPGWFIGIAALSWSLQAVRRQISGALGDDLPSTEAKRTARVVGFALATVVPSGVWIPAAWVASLAGLAWRGAVAPMTIRPRRTWRPNLIEVIMIFHQAHYFSYCYALPVLFAKPALGGVSWTGAWFACGWITYLLAESVWRRFSPTVTFIVGHIYVAALLILITLYKDVPWATIGLWILSGFGGGTVYCLTVLHHRQELPHWRIVVAEDIGHFVGVIVAIAMVMLFSIDVTLLPTLGASWALIAAASMLQFAIFRDKLSLRTGGPSNARQRD